MARGLEQARELADLAVTAATRTSSPASMSIALAAREHAWHGDVRAAPDAEESYRLAVETGDGLLIARATLHRMNFYEGQGRLRLVAEVLKDGLSKSLDAGGSVLTARLQEATGFALLVLAEYDEARAVLRGVLATGYRSVAGTAALLTSSLLASRVGRLDEAATHLNRAQEKTEDLEGSSNLYAFEPIGELLMAEGRAQEVMAHIMRAMTTHVGDPRVMDRALRLGASACAAMVQRAHDTGGPADLASARRSLDSIVHLRAEGPTPAFSHTGPDDTVQTAFKAIFDAEVARCRDEDPAEYWRTAVSRCRAAGLRWEEATLYCGWRSSTRRQASSSPSLDLAAQMPTRSPQTSAPRS